MQFDSPLLSGSVFVPGSRIRAALRLLALVTAVTLLAGGPLAAQRSQGGKNDKPKSKIPRGSSGNRLPVKKVDPNRREDIRKSAARIDELIETAWRKRQVTPNPRTKDSQFVRRVYLEITGTIPTLEQAHSFLTSKDPRKREKLIDQLLNSPGYASHHFNYWANIFRVTDRLANNNNIIAQPYHEWLKKSLRDNTPYDKWVHQMLTARGKIWEDPAVGFLMRDTGMELDAVDNMVRVFLGTQIGCARCHDHPFDRWTQREFYQMASFMYGARTRRGGGDKMYGKNPVTRVRNEMKKIDPKQNTGGDFNRILQSNFFTAYDQPGRRLKLPHDYQYDDGKPGEVVKPSPIFGDLKIAKGQTPRAAIADWVVSRDNPRFAKAIANRLWAKSMGIGLIDPVDDLRDDSKASIPPLLSFLTSEMIRLDFDMKEYLRIIYNTRTWQREATRTDVSSAEYYFPGPVLRRMTAEQAWDSLLTLAVYNVDSFRRTSFTNVEDVVDVDLKNVKAGEVLKRSKEYTEKYSTRAMRADDRKHSYKGMTLARASELPLPVPANHFLRQFGQGDRELINTANTDGSVTQILTMFNGQVTHMMLEAGSVIYDNVVKARNLKTRIEIIFLSILGRFPDKSEMDVARDEISAGGNAGYGNVIWALINTKEFLFIQ